MAGGTFRLKKWQARMLRVLGSAALIIGIFWFIPFSEVLEALRKLKPGYVGFAVMLLLASAYLEAIALWIPMNRVGIPGSQWHVFEIKMITRFYGQFLPSDLMASALKLHRLAKPTKQWGEAAAAIAYCRLLNSLVLVLLGLVFWGIEMPTGAGRWIGLILIGMAAALVLIHIAVSSPATMRLARRLLPVRALEFLDSKVASKAMKLIRTMVDSYRMFGSAVTPIVLLALVRHLLGIVFFSLVALSLDIHVSYLAIGWIRVVMHALMTLPISISGIGVREGSLVVLLQAYSVPASDAVALAFMLFAITLFANALGGLLELKNLIRPARNDVNTVKGGTE